MPNRKPDPARAAELAAHLALAYPAARPHMLARVILEAQKLALYAKARAEIECSYPMTEENITRAAKRIERQAARLSGIMREAVSAPDMHPDTLPRLSFGGDPRGACGTLHIPGRRGDGWGGEGFAIY